MKRVNVEIRGTSPLLIHRFSDEASQEKRSRRIEVDNITPREQAIKIAYINRDNHYYFSGPSIPGCMANAGANHKMRGSRKTLRFIVPSAVRMVRDDIVILDTDLNPAKDFEVDSRPVTIPSTKGRIMRHRPRFDKWVAKFELVINENLISIDLAQQLLTEAGEFVGIGDFRPAKGGPFGCFRITKFEEQK